MICFVSWCWAGLIIGVSFIATPAKFLANSLSLAQALEVGQVTFSTFRSVECVVGSCLLLCFVFSKTSFSQNRLSVVALVALMLVQYGLLLPQLDLRVTTIIQGGIVENSHLHWAYVLIELAKISVLLFLGAVNRCNCKWSSQ